MARRTAVGTKVEDFEPLLTFVIKKFGVWDTELCEDLRQDGRIYLWENLLPKLNRTKPFNVQMAYLAKSLFLHLRKRLIVKYRHVHIPQYLFDRGKADTTPGYHVILGYQQESPDINLLLTDVLDRLEYEKALKIADLSPGMRKCLVKSVLSGCETKTEHQQVHLARRRLQKALETVRSE